MQQMLADPTVRFAIGLSSFPEMSHRASDTPEYIALTGMTVLTSVGYIGEARRESAMVSALRDSFSPATVADLGGAARAYPRAPMYRIQRREDSTGRAPKDAPMVIKRGGPGSLSN